jgi:molybdopterin molybdotransferase
VDEKLDSLSKICYTPGMKDTLISYAHALQLTLEGIAPLDSEMVALAESPGRVVARPVAARVDSPSVDASLKDGYAVQSADVAGASPEKPVRLRVIGSVFAGGESEIEVVPGTAVRILTGARIPRGAQAVVAEEFTWGEGEWINVTNHAGPGRNILPKGSDVSAGQIVVAAGTLLRPAQVGLLAAAGHSQVPVIRQPRVAIIATGDEVVAPGQELPEGRLFASNLVTLAAWCSLYGMATTPSVVKDEAGPIRERLLEAVTASDAILTSGGAWKGERDLVVRLLDDLGWQKIYHRVKLGPGKAVAFGLWGGKPVFCLPGGPPSNQMAFIQLALPGLMKLAGHPAPGLPRMIARLGESVRGQIDWTQFIQGHFETREDEVLFHPFKLTSRLSAMAGTEGFVAIPEGIESIPQGARVEAQVVPLVYPNPPSLAKTPPAVISLVAKSGTGKTTFLEKLIPELKARGLSIGVLKHHAHTTPFDVPGKDTYRLAQAGADVVVGASAVQVAVFYQEDGASELELVIARHFEGVDLVLAEGFKQRNYPKIEIHRAAHPRSGSLLCQADELLALVTDEALSLDVPQFSLEDAAGVADLVLAWLCANLPIPSEQI